MINNTEQQIYVSDCKCDKNGYIRFKAIRKVDRLISEGIGYGFNIKFKYAFIPKG